VLVWRVGRDCHGGDPETRSLLAADVVGFSTNMLRGLASVFRKAGVVDRETGKPKYALHAFRHFTLRGASIRKIGAGVGYRQKSCSSCSGIAQRK
jgi:hypothetical protein